MWPTCGQSGYVTPAVLGVPNAKRGDEKSEMSTWLTCGQSGYISFAVLGVLKGKCRDGNQTCLRGPHVGKVATLPLPSWVSPMLTAGTEFRNGYPAHMRAKWLHHPRRLGGPQCVARGQKSETATWLTCGQSGCITPAILAVPEDQRREENHKWLRGRHVDIVATSHLPSWGSPTPSAGTTISNRNVAHIGAKWLHHQCGLGGPQRSAHGQTSKIATWSTCGQSDHITPAVLGVSNTQREDENPKWLHGPHVGKVATSFLPSWVSSTLSARTKIRNGYVAHMCAKWLHHPWLLGGPQRLAHGQRSETATWLTCGQGGYITPAVLGVLNGK